MASITENPSFTYTPGFRRLVDDALLWLRGSGKYEFSIPARRKLGIETMHHPERRTTLDDTDSCHKCHKEWCFFLSIFEPTQETRRLTTEEVVELCKIMRENVHLKSIDSYGHERCDMVMFDPEPFGTTDLFPSLADSPPSLSWRACCFPPSLVDVSSPESGSVLSFPGLTNVSHPLVDQRVCCFQGEACCSVFSAYQEVFQRHVPSILLATSRISASRITFVES